MLLHMLTNIIVVEVIFLPLNSGAGLDNDSRVKNVILNLVEGADLNYSAAAEMSTVQSMYACVTRNLSTTFNDLDLNTSLSIGSCIVCYSSDIGQKCAHQFNSSLTNITVNRFQNDTTQLMNFFKESVSLNDNGTKIICAYATGTEVAPHSTISLNVFHRPNDRYNLVVTVIASWSSAFILVTITCILLCACMIICIRNRHKYQVAYKNIESKAEFMTSDCDYHITLPSDDHNAAYSLNFEDPYYEYLDSIQPPVLMHIQYEPGEKRENEESSSENGAAPEHKLPEPELPGHISSRDDDDK